MKTTNFKGFFLLSILLSVFLLSGCKKKESWPISNHVTMKNNSSEEIHLWTSGEGIDASNKLAPGASRSHTITWDYETTENIIAQVNITVYAGRSGATITSITFEESVDARSYVVYSGGALSVIK